MASTKRKRRTKHRGNAAGIVETRGRTGRKPTPAEAKKQGARRRAWTASTSRRRGAAPSSAAIVAVVLFVAVVIALLRQHADRGASPSARSCSLIYIPLGYYTDLFLYRRRGRRRRAPRAAKKR